MGAVNLFSALQPTWGNRLEQIGVAIPLQVRVDSRLAIALTGFVLFQLAGCLWRRKRAAWFLTLLLLAISTLEYLFSVPLYAACMSIGLLLLMLLLGGSFYSNSDPPSVYQGLGTLAVASVFTVVYSIAGFTIDGIHNHQPVSFLAALNQTLALLASFFHSGPTPGTGYDPYFTNSIYVIGIATLCVALFMLVRPVMLRSSATAEERRRVAALVKKYGRSIVAPMAIFDDKHYFFSPGGSVIAYGVRDRGALALGGPIGPPEDVPAAISAFKDFCARNDWLPFFCSLLPDRLKYYESNGFKTLCIFYEAVVQLDSFSLEGHQNSGFRKPYHKIAHLGYRATVYYPPLDDKLVHELRLVSDNWLNTRYGREKYFFVGRFTDEYIRDNPVLVVHSPEGKVTAFANLLSITEKNEATSDLVRYHRKVENGIMEFLVVSMLNWAKSKGYTAFSLTASAVIDKGERQNDQEVPMYKSLSSLYTIINPFIPLKGIYKFYDKFHPRWEPLYLAYPGSTSLPMALQTAILVYTGKRTVWQFLDRI